MPPQGWLGPSHTLLYSAPAICCWPNATCCNTISLRLQPCCQGTNTFYTSTNYTFTTCRPYNITILGLLPTDCQESLPLRSPAAVLCPCDPLTILCITVIRLLTILCCAPVAQVPDQDMLFLNFYYAHVFHSYLTTICFSRISYANTHISIVIKFLV